MTPPDPPTEEEIRKLQSAARQAADELLLELNMASMDALNESKSKFDAYKAHVSLTSSACFENSRLDGGK
jgi:hypothetical protein